VAANDLLTRALALPGLAAFAERPGVHLVGGAVRDLKLGRDPGKDLDLVVEGDPVAAAAALGPPAATHERFGTVAVVRDGHQWDLVRARRETYPRPGALPEVDPASLAEDLRRRDFTVNTFALELATGREASVEGAEADLRAGALRVLHDGSFADDPTRLLRLARYGGRLGFAAEPRTRALARDAVAGGALATATPQRIGAEVRLAAREREPAPVWDALRDLGVDRAIAPGFGIDEGAELARALAALPPDGRRDVVVLALASRGVRDPGGLLDRLGFRAEEVRAVVAALDAPDLAGRSPGEVAERLVTPEQAVLAGTPEARRWLEETRLVTLAITGADLRAVGVPEGPALGAALREVLRAKRDGTVAGGRDEELAAALGILGR
jgi:tRNA nucleotidyltransferase (CCA-adding enzyme)